MVRLLCALSALLVAATVLWLSVQAIESLWLILHAHPIHLRFRRGFGVFISMFASFFVVFFPIMIATKERRAKRDEDVRLTPLVRRLPSGMREL